MPTNEEIDIAIKKISAKIEEIAPQLQDLQDARTALLGIKTETYTYQKPSPDGGKTPGEIVNQVNVPIDERTKDPVTSQRIEEVWESWQILLKTL